MATAARAGLSEYGPWHPGVSSELPARLLPLATVFRPENVFTSLETLRELHDLTGLAREELVVFRPQRLVVHELLIRVTADLTVPDGSKVEDLGVNFRRMTHTILTRHLEPHMAEIAAAYDDLGRQVSDLVEAELSTLFRGPSMPPTAARRRGLAGLWRGFGAMQESPRRIETEGEREECLLHDWANAAQSTADPLRRAVYRALSRLVGVIRAKHGRLWGDAALLAPIAGGMACNGHGSDAIGALIDPHIARAVAAEGYRWLPAQAQPVVMNTKGASASGKSTMRPLQKRLAADIGVAWEDFALISPDIWRKYLLDYESLGEHFRYAGTFTGLEVAIIDQKLDRYMARKAGRHAMSHLLIDRFRFDSFADSDEAGSNLLTRFGDTVYLFFMITPPHETVERSWKRGLEVGRFKAVDDLLAHNVEAYTGMPPLFFTWALRAGMTVHYEFLDNGVPFGERPRTVAFGCDGEMVVLDVKGLLDIDRYRKIDVDARCPEEVYPGADRMAADRNTQFLRECARRLAALSFADRDTGRVYTRLDAGRLSWTDAQALAAAANDPETRAGLLAVAPEVFDSGGCSRDGRARVLDSARFHTLGRWGPAA